MPYVCRAEKRCARVEDTGRDKMECAKPQESVRVAVVRAWLLPVGWRGPGWVSHRGCAIVCEGAGVGIGTRQSAFAVAED